VAGAAVELVFANALLDGYRGSRVTFRTPRTGQDVSSSCPFLDKVEKTFTLQAPT
jgi:hypothetical protein